MRLDGVRRLGAALALAITAATLPPSASVAAPASRDLRSPAVQATVSATVVVYGGTPAGVMAAIAARRNGASSVVLIEPTAHVGGMMSSGLVFTDTGDKATIGGISREFFSRMEAIEGSARGRYIFQARNAEKVFKAMLAEAGVGVRYGTALIEASGAVVKSAGRITAITTTSGDAFSAQVFVDASYEGDLMARAGVSYVVGREASSQYNEALGGVRPAGVVVSDVSGLNLGFPVSAPGPVGSADARIQSSNFRLCFTINNPANGVPFRLPPGYDPDAYAVVSRFIDERMAAGGTPRLSWLLSIAPTVQGKFDANDFGAMSISVPGANYAYPTGSYAVRAQITASHRSYTEGFLYFLANDPRVPLAIRNELGAYGLCKDEFIDNGNWPYLLYLREGRRMIGTGILTAHDIQAIRSKPDIIAIGSYRMDAHPVSRWVDAGRLLTEGTFPVSARVNYALSYAMMTPRRGEVTNLLVPVTSSASHVAQASVRMEPHYMMMGEAAGAAAALAAAGATAVQDVSPAALQARLRTAGAVLTDPGDIGSSQFYGDIVWAYHAGIISQCAAGRFCPTVSVTREMMADFLVRALDLPPASQDYFTDDEASPFEDVINRLRQAGITTGCAPARFCPLATVTRDQMASFLVRAYQLPPTSTDFFTDDETSIHEADINRLAAAGISTGCGGGKFCPARVVTRGEMMAFIHRAAT
jgi:hypothetical protein